MVWVKIPVAVDSGACAHVTTKDVFSLMCEESAGSKAREKWFGAEGTAILNLGKQTVAGVDDKCQTGKDSGATTILWVSRI